MADSRGILHPGREGLTPVKRALAADTNRAGLTGSLEDALAGADVFLGLSAGAVAEDAVARLAPGAIIFALANPNPEVPPAIAHRYAAIVATGRSDYPNQINNVLAFPGVFAGAFDAGARAITEGMKLAAAEALSEVVGDELAPDHIVPTPFDPRVAPAVAAAVAARARRRTEWPLVPSGSLSAVAPGGPVADRRSVERWLRTHGVPNFVDGYARPGRVLPRVAAGAARPRGRVDGPAVALTDVGGLAVLAGSACSSVALVLGYAVVASGLVPLGVFGLRLLSRTAVRGGATIVTVLPLLLVAVAFLFLGAETWQSIGRLRGLPLVLTALLFVVLGVAFVLRQVRPDLDVDRPLRRRRRPARRAPARPALDRTSRCAAASTRVRRTCAAASG